MTVSKHPSHKEKFKSQEKKEKGGIALGFEDQWLRIWTNGVTFSPTLKKAHLGLDPIYKTQKWFAEKDQIAREEGNLKDSARV